MISRAEFNSSSSSKRAGSRAGSAALTTSASKPAPASATIIEESATLETSSAPAVSLPQGFDGVLEDAFEDALKNTIQAMGLDLESA